MEIAWFCGRTVCVVVEHKQRKVLSMEELVVVEKIGELVLDAAINKLGEYKNKKEWNKLFVNTGEFFLKEVECGEQIIEDISIMSSCDIQWAFIVLNHLSIFAFPTGVYGGL